MEISGFMKRRAIGRSFVRRVEVSFVVDGWAALNHGPSVGASVVTAGVAELAGTEFGFAK